MARRFCGAPSTPSRSAGVPELFYGWVNWTPVADRTRTTADRCCDPGHASASEAYRCASQRFLLTRRRTVDQAGDQASFISVTRSTHDT